MYHYILRVYYNKNFEAFSVKYRTESDIYNLKEQMKCPGEKNTNRKFSSKRAVNKKISRYKKKKIYHYHRCIHEIKINNRGKYIEKWEL